MKNNKKDFIYEGYDFCAIYELPLVRYKYLDYVDYIDINASFVCNGKNVTVYEDSIPLLGYYVEETLNDIERICNGVVDDYMLSDAHNETPSYYMRGEVVKYTNHKTGEPVTKLNFEFILSA